MKPDLILDVEIYAFSRKLWKWKAEGLITNVQVNPFPHMSHRHITELLGYKTRHDMLNNWHPDNYNTLKLLCGPNGYALYKALLVQRGMVEENEC